MISFYLFIFLGLLFM
ncbi:hypothetical protein H7686_0001040 [Candidatus Phytoplasma asiaticum]|uniref:Uncharacterized protein n=1 Tax=Candidatus Phytoplasma asiaticum TaxID=2763338 RepID=A0AAX3B9T3_9MOLU|nr:hypothetical protein H7686_0001040 ['Parthenium hysterophorus' phyllody phytoplasma]